MNSRTSGQPKICISFYIMYVLPSILQIQCVSVDYMVMQFQVLGQNERKTDVCLRKNLGYPWRKKYIISIACSMVIEHELFHRKYSYWSRKKTTDGNIITINYKLFFFLIEAKKDELHYLFNWLYMPDCYLIRD